MLQDAVRVKTEPTTDGESGGSGEVIHRELKTKEDIKNHLKGLM
jgi:hypothetical protein